MIKKDKATGQTLIQKTYPSGINVSILPKKGFSRKFASIAVPFGSIHTSMDISGTRTILPSGTAHYMEHCIFSKDENGGLLSEISGLGGNANAYTSNTHTMYYFTAVENFSSILKRYAKAVVDPYLGQDRIEAEREIIGQELSMYMDDPDSRAYNELLSAMYVEHPIREDIGGTIESISEITSIHLEKVKKYMYSPPSMFLTISGNVSEEDIPELLVRNKAPDNGNDPAFYFPNEPASLNCKRKIIEMDVSVDSFLIGFKDPMQNAGQEISGIDKMSREKGGRLFWEVILGKSSDAFEQLYSEGLINESFGFHYTCEKDYAYLIVGGDSPSPEKASEKIRGMIQRAVREEIPDKLRSDFIDQKRLTAGDFIRSMDTVDALGMIQARAALNDIDIFCYPKIYDDIDPDQSARDMDFVLNDDLICEVFVKRKGK